MICQKMLQANKRALFYIVTGALIAVSCNKKEEANVPVANEPPITLDCNYFSRNANAVLKDNPNAPVDYIVTCRMSISDDVTIEPGVTIAFATDAGFRINRSGSLRSAGTAGKKITFTGVEKQPGTWAGILYESNDAKNELSHTIIEYAGGSAFNSNNDLGAVIVWSDCNLTFTDNLIQYSKEYGLNMNYRNVTAIIENNIFKANRIPVKISISMIDLIRGSNQFTDNTINKVEVPVTGTINKTTQWHKLSIPYMVISYSNIMHCDIKADVTVEPGTVIEMGAGTGMKVFETGSLKIAGSETEKIIIRGLNPVAGSWGRIEYHFTSSPNNQIVYAQIMHAGNNPSDSRGAVYMWANPTVSIRSTEFSDILSCAIYAAPSSPNPNLTASAVNYINCGGEICGN